MKLSNATLNDLPEQVERPTYDRSALTPGIVHIGLGNFHRAHQAWYTHKLMQRGAALDWAIIGAGVRPVDRLQQEKLANQDYLTTLIELDPNGLSAEVIGSMINFVPVQEGNRPLIAKMSEPAIRIVSLTVTEGGYFIDPNTQEFDSSHPHIRFDADNPNSPITAFGAIVAALKFRRDKGIGPFTCQSCDNLQGNGDVLRKTVVSVAKLTDPDLAKWIDTNCTFPNAMVDCIVPATGPNELALVQEIGIDDAAPVTHENFRQWVIEDKFCAGRPDWDQVGATFTSDVHSYETMKIRILNGGHQIVANVGELLSEKLISDCMSSSLIRDFFRKVATTEIVPQVSPVTGMTPEDYVDLIERRFSNQKTNDTVRRVAFDGSSRHAGFILPILHERIDARSSIGGLALVEAIWARMCEGCREDGSKIEANDPNWKFLNITAIAAKDEPMVWLRQLSQYNGLAANAEFSNSFTKWLEMIWSKGIKFTLKTYLEGN